MRKKSERGRSESESGRAGVGEGQDGGRKKQRNVQMEMNANGVFCCFRNILVLACERARSCM